MYARHTEAVASGRRLMNCTFSSIEDWNACSKFFISTPRPACNASSTKLFITLAGSVNENISLETMSVSLPTARANNSVGSKIGRGNFLEAERGQNARG